MHGGRVSKLLAGEDFSEEVVFSEVHGEHPVHGLDALVAANRFAEAWANQVAAEGVVPHVVRLAARTSSQKIVQRRIGDILEKASTQLRRMDVRLNDHPQQSA